MTPAEQCARAKAEATRGPRNQKELRDAKWRCRLREARERVGLTLGDVAGAMKMSKCSMHRIEHGSDLRHTTARKLAAFFGVGVDELWPELATGKGAA